MVRKDVTVTKKFNRYIINTHTLILVEFTNKLNMDFLHPFQTFKSWHVCFLF